MSEHSLFPTAVILDYHTLSAPHKMTIPLNLWSAISEGHPQGTLTNWEDDQVDVGEVMDGLITLLLPFFPDTATFTQYTIYTYTDEFAPARPRAAAALTDQDGLSGAGTPACQATYNFKTTEFGVFKLVMLDVVPGSNFQPVTAFPSPAFDDHIALAAYLTDPVNPFRGRDNAKIDRLIRVTYTLNERLRREYRYT